MRSARQPVALLALLAGVFWAGRESSHGLNAFWDHWWCPTPLVLIVAGLAGLLLARRRRAVFREP